jgi:hypothetical protein
MPASVLSVQLDRDRILFFRTSDVMLAEGQMGKSARQAVSDMSVRDLVILIQAGLRHESDYSIEQVSDMIDKAKQRPEFSVIGLWGKLIDGLVKSGIWPESKSMKAPVDPTGASDHTPGSSTP